MMDKLVSVIMPAYNCADIIGASIESVIAQTYVNWELIVVDDLSSDDTVRVVSEYALKDPRIVCIGLEKNSGAAMARNKAIEVAKGDFIAFLDSDDLWLPNKLEKQIAFMEANNCSLSCTDYIRIDDEGRELGILLKAPKKTSRRKSLWLANPMGNSTVIYNCSKIGKFYIPNIRKRNDFALWIKILEKEKYCLGLNEVLCCYRVSANSLSKNKTSLLKYQLELYHNIAGCNMVYSYILLAFCIFMRVFKLNIKKYNKPILNGEFDESIREKDLAHSR